MKLVILFQTYEFTSYPFIVVVFLKIFFINICCQIVIILDHHTTTFLGNDMINLTRIEVLLGLRVFFMKSMMNYHRILFELFTVDTE